MLAVCCVARAEVAAEASISSTQVGTGEPFQLTIQVTSDDKSESLPWPQVDGLEKFTVAKSTGTTQSSQTTIMNGKISNRNLYVTNFIYTLTAQKPGTFQIGPIRYAYKTYEKNMGSANVTVVKQEAGLTSQPSLSKKSAFIGEQLLYNLRIIPAQGVQQINLPQDLQKLIGEKFWFQRLDKNVEAKVVKINGENVRVFDVRIVLFPLLPGKVELSGIPVDYQQVSRNQRRRTGSVFDMFDDQFFNGASVVNMTAMASPISMEVSPLPGEAPADFTGSVGEYSLTANIDKTSLASGDALTLTVTIRGDGEPKTITKPKLPDLGQFEVFDPEVSTGSAVQGSTLVTTKTFKYVVVPHRKGDYSLGPVAFSYFDPAKRAYAEAKSQPLTISVTEGKEISASPNRIMSQREITDIGSDIRHIKGGSAPLRSEDDFLYKHFWYWLLFSPTPVAFAMIFLVRSRGRKLAGDATLKRKTLAGAQLKRRLKEANEALKQRNAREFYKALSQAVVGFASDKLNVEFRGLTVDDAKAQLRKRGISEASMTEYEKVLQMCDFGQFGGGARDEKAWKESLDAADNLLRMLDREL
ncbi:MAG: Oxygen tolerance [Fibrobacteres bacterium]|nr:Oxygen tolerance [Fibrobacterota bacterium]